MRPAAGKEGGGGKGGGGCTRTSRRRAAAQQLRARHHLTGRGALDRELLREVARRARADGAAVEHDLGRAHLARLDEVLPRGLDVGAHVRLGRLAAVLAVSRVVVREDVHVDRLGELLEVVVDRAEVLRVAVREEDLRREAKRRARGERARGPSRDASRSSRDARSQSPRRRGRAMRTVIGADRLMKKAWIEEPMRVSSLRDKIM